MWGSAQASTSGNANVVRNKLIDGNRFIFCTAPGNDNATRGLDWDAGRVSVDSSTTTRITPARVHDVSPTFFRTPRVLDEQGGKIRGDRSPLSQRQRSCPLGAGAVSDRRSRRPSAHRGQNASVRRRADDDQSGLSADLKPTHIAENLLKHGSAVFDTRAAHHPSGRNAPRHVLWIVTRVHENRRQATTTRALNVVPDDPDCLRFGCVGEYSVRKVYLPGGRVTYPPRRSSA